MALGALQNEKAGKQKAVDMFLNNQQATMLLAQEGYKVKVKDLMVDTLEDAGFKDADKYFEQLQPNPMEGGTIDPITGQPIQGAGAIPGGAGASAQGLPIGGNGQITGMGAFTGGTGQPS